MVVLNGKPKGKARNITSHDTIYGTDVVNQAVSPSHRLCLPPWFSILQTKVWNQGYVLGPASCLEFVCFCSSPVVGYRLSFLEYIAYAAVSHDVIFQTLLLFSILPVKVGMALEKCVHRCKSC